MKNIQLLVTVRGSIISNHQNPLDATLCGMLFEQGMAGDQAAQGGGLYDTWNDIPMASYAAKNDDHVRGMVYIIQNNSRSIGIQRILGTQDANAPISSTKYHRYLHPNLMEEYPTISSTDGHLHLLHRVRGNPEEIKNTMLRAGFMGKKRGVGFGEIVDVDYAEDDDDHPHYGITERAGEVISLIRPVPLSRTKELGIKDPIIGHGRWSSPYSPAVCNKHGYAMDVLGLPE